MYFVYVIKSINHNYNYVGISDNPDRRISQHNKGYNKTTKLYKPFETILVEVCPDRQSTRRREKFLKSGSGREYIKSIES